MKRLYVHTGYFRPKFSYQDQTLQLIPMPHSSGNWDQGFEFNNEYWLLLGVF